MKTRTHRVSVWLDDAEFEKFTRTVKLSGISKAASLRHLINGYVPKEKPPPDYYLMMEELRKVGTKINNLAKIAQINGTLAKTELDEMLLLYSDAIRIITTEIIEPEKI